MIKIGIFARNNVINENIVNGLNRENVIVLGMFPNYNNNAVDELNKLKNITKDLSGIILPGLSGEINNLDVLYIEYLYKINIPVLGICFGMQEMAKTFYSDICLMNKNYNHNIANNQMHKVFIKNTSKLYKILGTNHIYVNSKHNYCVYNPRLDVCAISSDSIIEAIESKNNDFFIGVQWHPELINDIYSFKLFNSFLNSCSDYSVKKMYKK